MSIVIKITESIGCYPRWIFYVQANLQVSKYARCLSFARPLPLSTLFSGREGWLNKLHQKAPLAPKLSFDNQEHYTDQGESEGRLFMTRAFALTGHIEAG